MSRVEELEGVKEVREREEGEEEGDELWERVRVGALHVVLSVP